MTRTIIAVALAVMLVSGVSAQAAKSPTVKSVNKTAKKAAADAKDAKHDVGVLDKEMQDYKVKVNDEVAEANRTAQTANGRVTTHSHTIATHPHDVSGDIAPNSKGSVTATCEPGEAVTGGGYEFDTNQSITIPQPSVEAQVPEGQGWKVTVNNLDGQTTVRLRAIANCITQ